MTESHNTGRAALACDPCLGPDAVCVNTCCPHSDPLCQNQSEDFDWQRNGSVPIWNPPFKQEVVRRIHTRTFGPIKNDIEKI